MLWAGALGLGTSALLLHRYAVQSMAIRYAVSASAMYVAGFMVGGYAYLRWWASQAPTDAHFPAEATPGDVGLYREQAADRRDHWLNISRWWRRDDDDYDDDYREDAERRKYTFMEHLLAWILKLFLGLIFSIVATLVGLVFGYLPILMLEALAGVLALVVVKFVVAGQAAPQYWAAPELGDYWQFVVGKTGAVAVVGIALAGAAGYWLEVNNPAATDLVDVVLPRVLAYLPSSFPSDLPAFLAWYLPSIVH
jgi:hypothetical protein